MHGRIYAIPIENGSITNANGDYDLWELDPATDKPVEIVGIRFDPTTEVGDAAEEILRIAVIRGHTTSGSGGSTPTPAPLKTADAAAGFACETLNSTIASVGTAVKLDAFGVNVRIGRELWYPPGCEPGSVGSSLLVVRLMAAVTDDIAVNACLFVRELG